MARRRIRYFLIAGVAAFVVYAAAPPGSSPSLPVVPQTATCDDSLVLLDLNNAYDVVMSTAGPSVGPGRVFCPSGPGFAAFGADLAPDGHSYGALMTDCTGVLRWGRIDPDGIESGGAATGLIPLGEIPYAHAAYAFHTRPAFVPEPDAGSPIAYRFGERPSDTPNKAPASQTMGAGDYGLDLYAVDSLDPYRERLLASNPMPALYNFGLGTTVHVAPGAGSQESRTNVFFTTTDAVYCWGTGPVCSTTGTVTQSGYLSLYRISRNAIVVGSGQPGDWYIADGGAVFRFQGATGDVFSWLVPPLSQIVSGTRRPCTPGGVRFHPDDRLLTSESGGTDTFTAVLTAAPASNVTLALSSSDPGEGTVSPASLTFTPADWSTPQTVTVTGVADGIADGAQDYAIVTTLTSADTNYDGKFARDLPARNHERSTPSITAGAQFELQPGSEVRKRIAVVSDADDPPGSLAVAVVPNVHSVTFPALTNTAGQVDATITVPCNAVSDYNRRFTIEVTDSDGNQRSDDFWVKNGPLAPPVLTYPNATLTSGRSGTVNPAAFDATSATLSVSAPTFTGTISADAAKGKLTVTNAGPAGDHTVEVTATHRCGAPPTTTVASFTIHVNEAPSITPATPSAQQGSPAASQVLATISDPESAASSLVVTAISVPAGITVGTIVNDNGTVRAPVSAACAAGPGPHTVTLRVTDPDGGTTDANATVDVTANTPPSLGNYAQVTQAKIGAGTTVVPDAGPADDSPTSVMAAAPGFTGTLSVDGTTGDLTVANAGPAGEFTVTITATDSCGATASRTVALTVYTCTYALSPIAANFGSASQASTVDVLTQPDCAWTAAAPPGSFATITGGSSGSGNGTVAYGVGANAGAAARTTVLTIGGRSFEISQSAAGTSVFALDAAASPGQVALAWAPVAGALSYTVTRAGNGGAFEVLTSTASTAHTDATVTDGIGYLYRVHAVGPGGTLASSSIDLAVPFVFTSAALTAGGPIRAADFAELRTAANAARAALGWPAHDFGAAIAPGAVAQRSHLVDLRTAVDAVRLAVGLPALSYTDPAIAPGAVPVRAAHVLELRAGLR